MERHTEKISVQGFFEARIFRNGKLIEEYRERNLITDIAKVTMSKLLAGETSGNSVSKIAFGTSNVAADPTDLEITNQWAKSINGFTYPEEGTVQFDWDLLVTENNGMSICEFGLLTAGGILIARRTRQNPIPKESDISIEGTWAIKYFY